MHWNSKFNQDPALYHNDIILAALNRAYTKLLFAILDVYTWLVVFGGFSVGKCRKIQTFME